MIYCGNATIIPASAVSVPSQTDRPDVLVVGHVHDALIDFNVVGASVSITGAHDLDGLATGQLDSEPPLRTTA